MQILDWFRGAIGWAVAPSPKATTKAAVRVDTSVPKYVGILFADVAGFSRLNDIDPHGFAGRMLALRTELIDPAIRGHEGRLVAPAGEDPSVVLAVFDDPVNALIAAAKMQRGVARCEAEVPPERRIAWRIGIHAGFVIVDGDKVFGDTVSVAARLEGEAPAGGSGPGYNSHTQLRKDLPLPVTMHLTIAAERGHHVLMTEVL